MGQTGLTILLDQVDAHAARHEREQRIGLGGGDVGELGREIELPQRRVDLVYDLALELALDAGQRVLAGLVVGRHQKQALVALVLGVLAEHPEHLVVLVGGDEEARMALLAGEVRGAGVGADQEGVRVGHRLMNRLQDVGEDRPHHEIDLVAVEKALDLGHRHVGLELVVDGDDLHVATAQLAAERLHREVEAVPHLSAQHRRRARQRHDDPDAKLVLRQRRGRRPGQHRHRRQRANRGQHASSLQPSMPQPQGDRSLLARVDILSRVRWKST